LIQYLVFSVSLIWPFPFQDLFDTILPTQLIPQTLVQCAAAMSSGCATSVITNPLDLVRTRVQVHRRPIPETMRWLWQSEGAVGIFTKGLTARMAASSIYSLCIILGYETVKKYSVYEEYRDRIRW
jgi:solute carrier family 25 protein 44